MVGREQVYIFLSDKYGWTIDEISNMTPAQQNIYLRAGQERDLSEAREMLRRMKGIV